MDIEVSESEARLAVKYSPSFLPSISRVGLSSSKNAMAAQKGRMASDKKIDCLAVYVMRACPR